MRAFNLISHKRFMAARIRPESQAGCCAVDGKSGRRHRLFAEVTATAESENKLHGGLRG